MLYTVRSHVRWSVRNRPYRSVTEGHKQELYVYRNHRSTIRCEKMHVSSCLGVCGCRMNSRTKSKPTSVSHGNPALNITGGCWELFSESCFQFSEPGLKHMTLLQLTVFHTQSVIIMNLWFKWQTCAEVVIWMVWSLKDVSDNNRTRLVSGPRKLDQYKNNEPIPYTDNNFNDCQFALLNNIKVFFIERADWKKNHQMHSWGWGDVGPIF